MLWTRKLIIDITEVFSLRRPTSVIFLFLAGKVTVVSIDQDPVVEILLQKDNRWLAKSLSQYSTMAVQEVVQLLRGHPSWKDHRRVCRTLSVAYFDELTPKLKLVSNLKPLTSYWRFHLMMVDYYYQLIETDFLVGEVPLHSEYFGILLKWIL